MSDLRSLNGDAVQQIADLAEQASEAPKHDIVEVYPAGGVGGMPHGVAGVLVPNTHTFKDLSADIDKRNEALADGPRRLVANEVAETRDGFISLTKRHAGKNSAIEAILRPSPSMTTYVDYHVASEGDGPEARRMQHSVHYAFPYSERTQAWLQAGSTMKTKREFTQFIQDRVVDLVSPFEVKADKGSVTRREFEAVLRLRGKGIEEREAASLEVLFGTPESLINGVIATKAISTIEQEDIESGFGDISFSYKKVDKTDAKEKLREYYLVEIEVFEGETPRVLPARLKATAVNGELMLKLEVIGLRDVIKDSFDAAVKEVAETTGLEVHRVKLAGKSS